eukprot:4233837-Amphidinium_carterae.4
MEDQSWSPMLVALSIHDPSSWQTISLAVGQCRSRDNASFGFQPSVRSHRSSCILQVCLCVLVASLVAFLDTRMGLPVFLKVCWVNAIGNHEGSLLLLPAPEVV